jgi:Zn-dependent peptidase ImmA (M78 family)
MCALGDVLLHVSDSEGLSPATASGTSRQQANRAFARELLLPMNALKSRFDVTSPPYDEVEAVGEEYGVSPLLVATTLVNKGMVDRDFLHSLPG